MGALTIIAVAISSIVILITLGKISRQMDRIISLLKTTDKKLSIDEAKEEITSSQIQRQLTSLTKEVKTMKGDVDWKG